jgi:hypothetical protein
MPVCLRKISEEDLIGLQEKNLAYEEEGPEDQLLAVTQWLISTRGIFNDQDLVGIVSYGYCPRLNCVSIDLIYILKVFRKSNVGKQAVKLVLDDNVGEVVIANPFTNDSENFFLNIGFSKDELFDPHDDNVVKFVNKDSLSQ